MPLISLSKMMDAALKGKYAVGYFESWNLESLKAVVAAAEEMRSPVIVGFNAGILADRRRILPPENLEYLGAIGEIAARNATVPVALILNEIPSFGVAMQGIRFGFNVLMYEDETEDLEVSIRRTRQVVEAAHAVGVTVESKVGHMPMAENGAHRSSSAGYPMTDPQEACRFVRETGVDALGVSVGNIEVLMKGKARMDLGLLSRIRDAVEIPLVLHGGSGIPDEQVSALVARGVCKMNLGAVLNLAFLNGMKRLLRRGGKYVSPKEILGSGLKVDLLAAGELAMKNLIQKKIVVYGSANKAACIGQRNR
jgi:ketose-bisphosphate aldolase